MTSTFLTVTVTNRNDVPVSLSNSYSATIAEDEPGGTNVLKTGASDEDGHGILFSLSGSSDFDILNTGMIRIRTGATLDYETQDSYNLTVEFSDGTALIFPSLYLSPCSTETTPRHFRVLHTPRTFPKKYRSARVSSSPAQVTKMRIRWCIRCPELV